VKKRKPQRSQRNHKGLREILCELRACFVYSAVKQFRNHDVLFSRNRIYSETVYFSRKDAKAQRKNLDNPVNRCIFYLRFFRVFFHVGYSGRSCKATKACSHWRKPGVWMIHEILKPQSGRQLFRPCGTEKMFNRTHGAYAPRYMISTLRVFFVKVA